MPCLQHVSFLPRDNLIVPQAAGRHANQEAATDRAVAIGYYCSFGNIEVFPGMFDTSEMQVAPAGTETARSYADRLEQWILLAVCLVYLAQLWSPLRLTGDSIGLLSIASSAADGHGFLDHGQKSHYLPGYPAMVIGLERAGAGHPWGLVGLNAMFLFVGFAGARYIARHYFQLSNRWAVIVLLFTALSFALIKHFPLPLTDIPFFGMSMAVLALLVRAARASRAGYIGLWTAAAVLSTTAVLVRPIAIALFPALAWSVGARFRFGEILRRSTRVSLATGIVAIAVVAGASSVVLLRTKYVQEALTVLEHQGTWRGARNLVTYRVHEAGELLLNAPASKLGPLSSVVWLAGAIAMAATAFCIGRRRMGLVGAYLIAYGFILLLWPYQDTRFWTPVLPLIFAGFLCIWRPWLFTGWKLRAAVLYATAYTLMGLAALAYSTSITFSGRDFPNRYGDENLRPTYRLFYSDPRADRSRIDQPALEVLERYGRRSASVK
jgi:hypothetical protein